jgi:FkbM family methyltransferase
VSKVRKKGATWLNIHQIDSLELLEALHPLNPQVFFDIGANVGSWTLLAKAIYPQSEIHAFEPLVGHHSAFLRHTKGLSGVHFHKVALGECEGVATMRITDLSDASSLLPLASAGENTWSIRECAQEQVPVKRLDDYRQECQIPFPSLIKLDVQGFELSVLKGSINCLEHASAVLAEVSFREFYKGQCLFHDVVKFLAEHDFFLYAFGSSPTQGQPLLQSDALFLKKDALSRL